MSLLLPPPRALVFDWDNTLVDSWLCIQKTYNATFRHFGLPDWSMEETKGQVAASMRDSFPAMFGDRWPEAREVFSNAFAEIHLDHLAPLPDAAALLEALAETDLVLAVVSNKRGHFLRKEAEVLGWTDYFSRLVGAEDAAADKPDAASVLLALDGTGVNLGPDVWFIGDSPVDIQCAVNAGCSPVLLRPEPPRPGEFPVAPPHVLDGCRSLGNLLCELSVPIALKWC
ncbi:HAD family hydrolase [Magnetospirillum molischianum]|uniref:phosphoglycolate phosphatase n=1 Tax=Magnetospirillum molischianum DSM 120 TaxID=1150626 RepID=H8FXP3_MAGML|nr:HAD-IA family hydrolase [Magnetospirillum molischianum]CCG43131.1 Predicted phosphatase [Magnetospirillum molischianum DSM 120]